MSKISKIKARQIFDSRGNPTVEVDILLMMVFWVELQFPQVPQPENMKQ